MINFLIIDGFKLNHGFVHRLKLVVFALDDSIELTLLGFEKFSTFLFLLCFPHQGLRSQLHLCAQTRDLLLELQPCSCKFDFHILNLGLLFGDLHFEIFSQFVILLQEIINFLSISCL
jgi:hypothetical protein